MKALVGAFNQEKALVGAFSVIVQLHRLIDLRHYAGRHPEHRAAARAPAGLPAPAVLRQLGLRQGERGGRELRGGARQTAGAAAEGGLQQDAAPAAAAVPGGDERAGGARHQVRLGQGAESESEGL